MKRDELEVQYGTTLLDIFSTSIYFLRPNKSMAFVVTGQQKSKNDLGVY